MALLTATSFVFVVGACTQSDNALKRKIPTSLSVRVFWLTATFGVTGSPHPPKIKTPPDEAPAGPLYWLALTGLLDTPPEAPPKTSIPLRAKNLPLGPKGPPPGTVFTLTHT